jgi:hypothetical protein
VQTSSISAETLARTLEAFFLQAPHPVLLENGEPLFDFRTARYSVSGEGKCVLHVWSDERNIVRRVVDLEIRPRMIRLSALRFGQAKPDVLEICADAGQRSAVAQRASRLEYQRVLMRLLEREYPGAKVESVSSKADLEHSFSPIYTRAVVRQGQSGLAILGVNEAESQASIDAALTFGILWLDYQRRHQAGRCHIEGLKLFVPYGCAEVVSQRMAHLDRGAAKWQLFQVGQRAESCTEVDVRDHGNLATRLGRAVDTRSARERFAASIARIRDLVPESDVTVESGSEIAFRLYGLEFARARMAPEPDTFRNIETIVFGMRPAEYTLDASTEEVFHNVVQRLTASRHPAGSHGDPLYRLCPERWLESLITRDVRAIDERLDPRFVYSQVPAFTACDRAMLDVLSATIDGCLAILELKADDDIHLPLQGLDYWARVRWHQQNGGFVRNGYFAGLQISDAPPLLYLVTPVLRTHPATSVLLKYLSPQIEWQLVQLDEHWRAGVRVVNRQRAKRRATEVSTATVID